MVVASVALAAILIWFVSRPAPVATSEDALPLLPESEVVPLPLEGALASADAEISSMTWYGDRLVLVPQYSSRVGEDQSIRRRGVAGTGHWLWIPRLEVRAAVNRTSTAPLRARLTAFDGRRAFSNIEGFEGVEAVAFDDRTVFVVVEAMAPGRPQGVLMRGDVDGDFSSIRVHPSPQVMLPSQNGERNLGFESVVVVNDRVVVFFEANGQVNPRPRALSFSVVDLRPLGSLSMPPLEYRLTDATDMDDSGTVWVINYRWSGQRFASGPSMLTERFGTGRSHRGASVVERIVALKLTEAGWVPTQEAPRYLRLGGGSGRNWEGIVRFDDGFLLVTDRFPSTLLAFMEP